MPTTTPSNVYSHPSLDHAGGGTAALPVDTLPQVLQSTQLLQGHKTIGIVHNGSVYRLQATRLGKLILTK